MKFWIYENHIMRYAYTQPLQLRKESLKKKNTGLYGIRSLDLCDTGAVLLVERCTSIAEVKGSNSVQAGIFFRLTFPNCKSCVYNCDDHPSFNCFCFWCCCCLVCLFVCFFYETVMCWGFTQWKKASRTVKLHTENLIHCPTKHMVKAN